MQNVYARVDDAHAHLQNGKEVKAPYKGKVQLCYP